jgi:serine/threonine protein kinase/Tol biopolymer transport system component
MTLERGTLLHKRYRIVEILGQGGMGSVYRAMDENLGVEIALKENLFTTDEYARQFRLEAVILANLRHPNLPRVSDHFVVGDQGQYLVMDYIEGEDLRQRMERTGMITEEDAVLIGAAMCDALGYLHTRKPSILHRDLKPGNVKITPEGHIFLVDFGLAKVVQGTQATTTGARAMTPGYSPPEQYGTARTDSRTDIYSLGATLYASLCGVIPEDGLARAMDNAQLTPLRKRNPKISKRLATVIEKAMAIDPAERYQTGDDFKRALLGSKSRTERLTGDYIVSPPPPSEEIGPAEEMGKPRSPLTGGPPFKPENNGDDLPFKPPKRARKRGCFLPVLLLLAIISLAVVLWVEVPGFQGLIGRVGNTPTATRAILPTETVEPLATVTSTLIPTRIATLTFTPAATPSITFTPSLTFTPAPTPQGGGYGQFAFASDRSGIPQIYLANGDGSNQTVLTYMTDGACRPSWSPDGMRLVFASPCSGRDESFENSSLYIINADGTELTPLLTEPGGDFDPAWSPDGTRIAFASWRDDRPLIYTLDLATETVTRLVEPSSGADQALHPVWSSLGNQILYVVERFDVFQIWTMTDTGKGQQQLIRSGQEYWDLAPAWSPDGRTILFSQRKVGPSDIWLMSIIYEERASQPATRLNYGSLPVENVEFSPDGFWLIFESLSDNDNRDLFLVTLDGASRIRLTSDSGADFDAAWRPIKYP